MQRYLDEVKRARRNVKPGAEPRAAATARLKAVSAPAPTNKRFTRHERRSHGRTDLPHRLPDVDELVTVPIDLAALPSSCDLSGLAIEFESLTIDDDKVSAPVATAVIDEPVAAPARNRNRPPCRSSGSRPQQAAQEKASLTSAACATEDVTGSKATPSSCGGDQDSDAAGATPIDNVLPIAEVTADAADYHEAARNLLARLPRNSSSLVLIVAADKSAYSPCTVAGLLGALAELQEDPVLAIDCSREGTLADHFGITRIGRLPQFTAGEAPWQESIVQTCCPGLCILPVDGNSEAPSADDLGRLYDEARSPYPLVAVDAGSFSDARVRKLAKACDACFVVVRRDVTKIATAIGLREKFASCGAALMGSVLLSGSDLSSA